jgi:hypothetical protein
MTEGSQLQPLLTHEQVRAWVAERDSLAAEYGRVYNRLKTIQQKLDALAQILPENVVASLIGKSSPLPDAAPVSDQATLSQRDGFSVEGRSPKPPKRVPITDAVESLLASEAGGRTPAWLRKRLAEDGEFRARVKKTPTSVSNALLRLVDRGKVIRDDKLYYHPDMYAKIQSGELVEERLENGGSFSFNSVMHKVMQARGGSFTAADAITAAKESEVLRSKVEEQPSRVYSWLSREVFKNKLQKEGEFYSYPPEEGEAPDGSPPSAPIVREGATSLFPSQQA